MKLFIKACVETASQSSPTEEITEVFLKDQILFVLYATQMLESDWIFYEVV